MVKYDVWHQAEPLQQEAQQPSAGRCRSISGPLQEQLHVSSKHRVSLDGQELPPAQFMRCASGSVSSQNGAGIFARLDDASPVSSEFSTNSVLLRQISGSAAPQHSVLSVAQGMAAGYVAPAHAAPAHAEATHNGSLVLQVHGTHPAASGHHDAAPHASPVMQVAASPRLSRAWAPPQMGVACAAAATSAGQHVTTAVLPSPTAAGQPVTTVMASPGAAAAPVLCRTISGGSSHGAPLGSPQSWTTVTARRRSTRAPGEAPAAAAGPPPEMPPTLTRLKTEGDSVDLYYSQKEVFYRGWTREAKQSRSVKYKKQTDYQVEKRKQQSMRDKAAMANSMAEEAADDDF